jgi:hypothetical protein
VFKVLIVVGILAAGYAAYQLWKAKKAVTVGNVVAQAKTDVQDTSKKV